MLVTYSNKVHAYPELYYAIAVIRAQPFSNMYKQYTQVGN